MEFRSAGYNIRTSRNYTISYPAAIPTFWRRTRCHAILIRPTEQLVQAQKKLDTEYCWSWNLETRHWTCCRRTRCQACWGGSKPFQILILEHLSSFKNNVWTCCRRTVSGAPRGEEPGRGHPSYYYYYEYYYYHYYYYYYLYYRPSMYMLDASSRENA